MTERPDIRAAVESRLKRRHAAERRFRLYGLLAVAVAIGFLAILLGRIVQQGHTAFWTHSLDTELRLEGADISSPLDLERRVAEHLVVRLDGAATPEGVAEMRALLSSETGHALADRLREEPRLAGRAVLVEGPLGDEADLYLKGHIERATPENERRLTNRQLDWLDEMRAQGLARPHVNWTLFTRSDSTQPEMAGVLGAVVGSALMLLVTAALAIPVGVGAAVYLEEFAPKNRWTGLVEVNINNLAAVPSIVYGLLGLAVFIGWMGLPRASPLVGGMVLALMALPTVIIATRASLRAVPPSIRDAALALGASRTQTVFGHVLPLALPGVMTGAIISLAHALGETAPLLMIGMVAFVPGVPDGILSAAGALPTQIYIWENASELAFHERTAAAILVLLAFMVVMNAAAVVLRTRLERRW